MTWDTLLSPERRLQKKTSGEPSRSSFEQDYDRIIFSHPFRRLQDKTQVHPLPEHDFVHTRLTHSLEVSSVGRSLGKKAGEIILERHPELRSNFTLFDFGAVTAAAALAHDLGNPPFGHAGEDSISDFFKHHPLGKRWQSEVTAAQWEDLIRFEGNAQGFRILNKDQYGLRLTYATLGAFTKYPCPALVDERQPGRKSQKKFGFFQSERESFIEVADALGLIRMADNIWCRHPLAFLVEAADDICYNIIDLEDGCRLGLVSFDETVDLLGRILGDKLNRSRLAEIDDLNQKLGILRSMAIGQLIDACIEVFADHESAILDGSFDQALADLSRYSNSLREISRVSVERIYHARHVVEIEASGHQILPGLLEEFTEAGASMLSGNSSRKHKNLSLLLPREIASGIKPGIEPYDMLRTIIDFVSGMTDRHALSLYRKIKGISL